ncbi:MAG TPA: M56 family metallopeptidase [Longimicrobium sp.]|jgi:TonB family protein|uniref:M56 family metallopeptidase n=1 Tax=Longimicrobium sp. TaxID=2029185 RepID=UPI002ED7BD5B
MVHWMAYCLGVGALLSAAALAMEAALRSFRRPARWVWAAALALSIAVPAAVRWGPGSAEPPASPLAVAAPLASGTGSIRPAAPVAAVRPLIDLHALDRPLLVGWAGLSIGVAFAWLGAWGMLQWRRRRWRERRVDGVRVLVSADTGPAVVGWIRPRIVLPEGVVRDADPSTRRMILQHETEHLAAGDPRMLAFALIAIALVPWSPAAWWQLRRLRLAMEVDCDARVLARRADVRAYGELLLEVGRRGAGTRLPVAAMSEPRSFLERRIRMMTQRSHPRRIPTSLGLVALSAAAVAVVQLLPIPSVPAAAAQVSAVARDTVQPVLVNPAQIVRALDAEYPPLLREAGITGIVEVRLKVTAQGGIAAATVVRATDPRFSEPATRALRVARFRPARAQGAAVATTITIPVRFEPALAPGHPRSASAPQPWDEAPQLVNGAQVPRMLEAEYPPLLREAGIRAEAQVSIRISATGVVESVKAVSASHAEARAAAERALRGARFRPARKDGVPIAAEVLLPVLFTPPAAQP